MTELSPIVQKFVADMQSYIRDLNEGARRLDQFGHRNEAAALAARKLGLAAEEGGHRAAKALKQAAEGAELAAEAQKKAKDAAEGLARGELTAKEAAEAQARASKDVARAAELQQAAVHAVERADIAAAAAAHEAAKEADKQAAQYRQVARDAELSAGVQRLASLRAAGAVKQHNTELTRLRGEFGKLGHDATKGMTEMESVSHEVFAGIKLAGTDALEAIGNIPPLIATGLALLPPAALLAGGAITVGLGGALAGIGLAATVGTDKAKTALEHLADDVRYNIKEISKPFEDTWVSIAKGADLAFQGILPDLKNLFSTLAPQIGQFAEVVGSKIPDALHNMFASIGQAFGPLMLQLESALPYLIGKIGDSIAMIASAAGDNADVFGALVKTLGDLIEAAAVLVVGFETLMGTIRYLGEAVQATAQYFHDLGEMIKFVPGLELLGIGAQKLGDALHSMFGSSDQGEHAFDRLNGTTGILSTSMDDLTNSVKATKDGVDALARDIKGVLDPALAASNDATRLAKDMDDLKAALKASGGAMGTTSDALRASKDAFTQAIGDTAKLAQDQIKLTGNMGDGQKIIKDALPLLLKLAGHNAAAREQVARLAQVFSLQLPGAAVKARSAALGVGLAIASIHSKNVGIHVDVGAALGNIASVIGQLSRLHSMGLAHGGLVGAVRGYAGGGPVQSFPGGGQVFGAGTSTSDSIDAKLSNGEFVMNAASTSKNLPALMAMNSSPSGTFHVVRDPNPSQLITASNSIRALPPPMPLARRHYAEILSGGSGGAARPHVVNNNIYIGGSVWSETELANVVQRLFLQGNIRVSLPAGR